jgi:hypothetical protein
MNKNNKIHIKENTTSSSGEYNGPIELGLKKQTPTLQWGF